MDPYIGKLLDNRYEILELVGTGGMAKVYKARCHRLNRLVAIKILKPELAQDADFRRRFHDESQAVAMLSQPDFQGRTAYFAGIDKARFRRKVVPGDVLLLETEIIKVKGPIGIGRAVAKVGDQVAAQAELTFSIG